MAEINPKTYALSVYRITGRYDVKKYTIVSPNNPLETAKDIVQKCIENGFISINPRSKFGMYLYDDDFTAIQEIYLTEKGFGYVRSRLGCKLVNVHKTIRINDIV